MSDGNLKDSQNEDVYYGVFTLRGIIIIILIDELNSLKIMKNDIGNVYIESSTN